MAALFYKPEEAWVGDVIPYYANGEFKLFYLHNWRGKKEGKKSGWYLLGTNDFIQYTEYGPCDIQGGTGHVLEIDGLYHMFYCKFPKNAPQLVCHAISDDLKSWKEIPEDSFAADDQIYELSDWRDPFVFWNEEKQEYWMLLAALEKGAHNRKGCTALCTSKDLKHWEYKEPLYAPNIHVSAHECPDLFKIGEWWYLVYSAYTERFATFYRMSKSLHGPWIAPKEDTFDGRAYYAAKTVSDGTRRYAFGWNPTKVENLFGWNPERYDGNDYNTWDWGGNLIVHEIVQKPDGLLMVKCPDTVEQVFAKRQPVSFAPGIGHWRIDGNDLSAYSPYSFSCAVTSDKIPDPCILSAKLTFTESTRGIGLMVRTDENFDKAYYVKLEPQRNRIVFRSAIMQSEEGGKTFPYEAELERPIELIPGKLYEVKVIVDGTICEIYVDDEVAMSARMYDIKEGQFALFVVEGSATFQDVQIATLR